MGKNEHIKNMNMKVAGTLKPKKKHESPDKTSISDCQSSNTNSDVYDSKLFEGLNAKQKKNLRKKLQRQRKKKEKLNSSSIASSLNSSQKDKISDPDNAEIDDIDIDIGGSD